MPHRLDAQQMQLLYGSPQIGEEFSRKTRELDRRLKLNGLNYNMWGGLTDRQQDIFSHNLFKTGDCATDVKNYVHGALEGCGCPDTKEQLHHHSPQLMKQLEIQLANAPVELRLHTESLDNFIDATLASFAESEDA